MACVVAASGKAKSGEEGRIRDVIKTMTPPTRAEAKCPYYQAQVSPEDPTTFFLYEQYADARGCQDHKTSEHCQKHVLGCAIDPLENRQVATYETIDV